MENKKVVFIDYDGTLYDHSINKVHDNVIDLLKLAKTRNCDIYLTTGRPIVYFKYQNDILKYLKGIISTNGSYIKIEEEVIYKDKFDLGNLEKLFDYSNNNKISILYFGENNSYIDFKDNELENRFITNNKYPINIINNIKEIKEDIYQVCVFATNDVVDKMILEFPNLEIYKWGTSGADIVLKGISKGKAIKKIIEINSYEFNNTYGIGDGENDIPMFDAVKNSIAMGNSSDEVKKHASIVTDTIYDNGLEKILEKIIKS